MPPRVACLSQEAASDNSQLGFSERLEQLTDVLFKTIFWNKYSHLLVDQLQRSELDAPFNKLPPIVRAQLFAPLNGKNMSTITVMTREGLKSLAPFVLMEGSVLAITLSLLPSEKTF